MIACPPKHCVVVSDFSFPTFFAAANAIGNSQIHPPMISSPPSPTVRGPLGFAPSRFLLMHPPLFPLPPPPPSINRTLSLCWRAFRCFLKWKAVLPAFLICPFNFHFLVNFGVHYLSFRLTEATFSGDWPVFSLVSPSVPTFPFHPDLRRMSWTIKRSVSSLLFLLTLVLFGVRLGSISPKDRACPLDLVFSHPVPAFSQGP